MALSAVRGPVAARWAGVFTLVLGMAVAGSGPAAAAGGPGPVATPGQARPPGPVATPGQAHTPGQELAWPGLGVRR